MWMPTYHSDGPNEWQRSADSVPCSWDDPRRRCSQLQYFLCWCRGMISGHWCPGTHKEKRKQRCSNFQLHKAKAKSKREREGKREELEYWVSEDRTLHETLSNSQDFGSFSWLSVWQLCTSVHWAYFRATWPPSSSLSSRSRILKNSHITIFSSKRNFRHRFSSG